MTKVILNNGRVIGTFDENTYIKPVEKSKHFMKIFGGYGIDAEFMEEELIPNNALIEIIEKDTGHRYFSYAKDWQEYNLKRTFDHDLQYFLPVAKMSVFVAEEIPPVKEVKEKEEEEIQPPLVFTKDDFGFDTPEDDKPSESGGGGDFGGGGADGEW